MANVIFKAGTKAQYDALAQKDANTLYWLYDVLLLYKGDALYGTGNVATNLVSGLMSADDKKKLDILDVNAGNLQAVDASVVVADAENGGKTIGVRLSEAEGNAAQLKEDGLYVPQTQDAGPVWGEM